jgi:hypothetical protein
MASALYPYCSDSYVALPEQFHDRLQCRKCGKMFLAEIKDGRARTVTPATLVLDAPSGLEPQLASDLREACACFNVGAYKASVVMARRFLEALLDTRGFKGKTLFERIKVAHSSGAVSELLFQLASSARILGNYGAHYSDDELTQIGQDEAELVLNMVRQILKSLVR